MSFSLKNVGATYQRLVNRVFKEQIGHNMEVCIDDMLIKSCASRNHVDDLETFIIMCKYQIKLNPAKCAFGITSSKFLGFMVSHGGIKANPENIQA